MTAFVRTTGKVGGASYRETAKQIQGWIEEELTVAGEAGKGEAQGFVDIAGTQESWSGTFKGRTGPNAGRNDGGDMRKALDYRIIRGKSVGLVVGWPYIWEKYFGAQDAGFDAPGFRRADQHVEGMGLMAHLRFYMRDRVDSALDRVEERILNAL